MSFNARERKKQQQAEKRTKLSEGTMITSVSPQGPELELPPEVSWIGEVIRVLMYLDGCVTRVVTFAAGGDHW